MLKFFFTAVFCSDTNFLHYNKCIIEEKKGFNMLGEYSGGYIVYIILYLHQSAATIMKFVIIGTSTYYKLRVIDNNIVLYIMRWCKF